MEPTKGAPIWGQQGPLAPSDATPPQAEEPAQQPPDARVDAIGHEILAQPPTPEHEPSSFAATPLTPRNASAPGEVFDRVMTKEDLLSMQSELQSMKRTNTSTPSIENKVLGDTLATAQDLIGMQEILGSDEGMPPAIIDELNAQMQAGADSIRRGANPLVTTSDGYNLLQLASMVPQTSYETCVDIIRAFAKNPVETLTVLTSDVPGHTEAPLELAQKSGHTNFVEAYTFYYR